MHPIVRMRKIKGGFIKTRFNMVPIKNYGSKLLNNASSYVLNKATDALQKLTLGQGARKKLELFEIEPENLQGGKIRKRIKPLNFKH